jgi:HK97 family phage major capsid protein
MNRKIIDKMFDIRANNTNSTSLIDDTQQKEFIVSLTDAIRRYSKLLQKAQLIQGKPNMRYIFMIEDDANVVQLLDDETIKTTHKISKKWECENKSLGLEILIPNLVESFYESNIENIITQVLYKPFVKVIEKNVISGTYFDKPLFQTTKTITGTNDFDGLLKLARKLKDTYDDGCIVGNSAVISGILDDIKKESYLNEYFMKGTIEGIQVLSTKDTPVNVDGKFLVGFDPNKIGLLLLPLLKVKKICLLEMVDRFFQIYGFCNGGDIFDTAIGLKEAE